MYLFCQTRKPLASAFASTGGGMEGNAAVISGLSASSLSGASSPARRFFGEQLAGGHVEKQIDRPVHVAVRDTGLERGGVVPDETGDEALVDREFERGLGVEQRRELERPEIERLDFRSARCCPA